MTLISDPQTFLFRRYYKKYVDQSDVRPYSQGIGNIDIRNTEETILRPQYFPNKLYSIILAKARRAAVSLMAKGCSVA